MNQFYEGKRVSFQEKFYSETKNKKKNKRALTSFSSGVSSYTSCFLVLADKIFFHKFQEYLEFSNGLIFVFKYFSVDLFSMESRN